MTSPYTRTYKANKQPQPFPSLQKYSPVYLHRGIIIRKTTPGKHHL